MESKNSQVIRNGRQLFEFMIGLNPGNYIVQIFKDLSRKEKFLENKLLLFCESIFSLMQVHGGKKVFQLEQRQTQEFDWEEIEDESQIIARLEGRMGKQLIHKLFIFFGLTLRIPVLLWPVEIFKCFLPIFNETSDQLQFDFHFIRTTDRKLVCLFKRRREHCCGFPFRKNYSVLPGPSSLDFLQYRLPENSDGIFGY